MTVSHMPAVVQAIADGVRTFGAIRARTGLTEPQLRHAISKLRYHGYIEMLDRANINGAATWVLLMPVETALERLQGREALDCTGLMEVWPVSGPARHGTGRVIKLLGEYEPGPVPKSKREVRA